MDNRAEYERWQTQVCDNCKTPLIIHGRTVAGQMCDLQLAMTDFWRGLFETLLHGGK